MTTDQKLEIQKLVENFCQKQESQAKACQMLKVSEGIVINIRKGQNWETISDSMWLKIGRELGYSAKGVWKSVDTQNFRFLTALFEDAKEYSNVYAITAEAGAGKTHAATHFKINNPNVYHLACAEYFNRKEFLSRLLEGMGKDSSGSVSEMMDSIVDTLRRQESPIIILDEADKLNDTVLYFFITLYNALSGKCGIVLMATDYLSKRIQKGRKFNRKGYAEIYSRIGRRFVALRETTKQEVETICKANGVTDSETVTHIYSEFEGDLRRVERAVHKAKVIAGKK